MRTLTTILAATLWTCAVTAPALVAATASAPAKPAATAQPAMPAANAHFTVGTMHVWRYGDHGRPLILIPGLASGAWVWNGTVEALAADHVIYTVTLAGFDGTPPPKQTTHLMDQADASLLKLIQSRHIDHPVLIGHSLGGTLAIRFATEHSQLLSGVIAAEGLPVFPGAEKLTDAQRKARAQALKAMMAKVTPAQYRAQQIMYMSHAIIDPKLAAHYAKLTGRSDPAATAQYMAEDMAADHRAGLKHVSVPLLEIAPYDAADAKMMAAMNGKKKVDSAADKVAYYQSLLDGAPHAKVVSIAPARHFMMLDQPAKFIAIVQHFLAKLPAPK